MVSTVLTEKQGIPFPLLGDTHFLFRNKNNLGDVENLLNVRCISFTFAILHGYYIFYTIIYSVYSDCMYEAQYL